MNRTRPAGRICWGRVTAKAGLRSRLERGALLWARHGSRRPPGRYRPPGGYLIIPEGKSYVPSLLAIDPPVALSTQGLVTYLQGLFGPLFLGIVGIVALFFLFTREITRFVQFIVLAVLIAVVFYTPGIVQALATGITNALGVH